eukprot:3703253-Rhodomonas_salina.2
MPLLSSSHYRDIFPWTKSGKQSIRGDAHLMPQTTRQRNVTGNTRLYCTGMDCNKLQTAEPD